jgi:hypothetical protein
MSHALKTFSWIFIVLSLWNFLFPPKVGMDYPDHMASDRGRSFYYTEGFHKAYHPTVENSEVRTFGGGFVIHWDNLLVTQALIAFLSLSGFLIFCNRSREPKKLAEQGVAPQSATRSESDSEGGDNPQPESNSRSR